MILAAACGGARNKLTLDLQVIAVVVWTTSVCVCVHIMLAVSE